MRFVYFSFLLMCSIIYADMDRLETLLKVSSTNDIQSYSVTGNIMSAHTDLNIPFKMNVKKNKRGLYINVRSNLNYSEVQLDHKFNVMMASFNVFEDALIEKINYNQRFAKRNQYDELVFKFFKNKIKTKEKGVYYTKNTFDTFSIIPVLQRICDTNTRLFSADLGVQHMALKAPVILSKDITSNISQYMSNYTLPDQLSNYLASHQRTYIVYTLKVSGWQGFIYNYRHFYVFKHQAPYEYVGHWGGSDKTNIFSWVFNP